MIVSERRIKHGYPQITRFGEQMNLARWVFLLFRGRLGPKEVVRHTCDNTACVNPMHLIRGSQADNVADAVERDRFPRGERHSRATLSTAAVRAIYADARPYRVVAAEYGTTNGTVSKIKSGHLRRRETGASAPRTG